MLASDLRRLGEAMRQVHDGANSPNGRQAIRDLASAVEVAFSRLYPTRARGFAASVFPLHVGAFGTPAGTPNTPTPAVREDRGPTSGPGATLRVGDRVRLLYPFRAGPDNADGFRSLQPVGSVLRVGYIQQQPSPTGCPMFRFEGETDGAWSLVHGDFERVDE